MTFWRSFVKQVRKLAGGLQEQPTADIEDVELEHFMLYHGLVGTSPENQREFRDVRADIHQAVSHQSPVEMAIALKVPPLWWSDKLTAIFGEVKDQIEALRACLLPENQDVPEADPLRHPDWKVRANAARALAILKFDDAAERMICSLDESTESAKPAFSHLAYALGTLGGPLAKNALIKHLHNDEPWFRVDAAAALALWPQSEVFAKLAQAMMEPHRLSDYMAYAIATKYPPKELLQLSDPTMQDGALEICIGLAEAANGPFGPQVLTDTNLAGCMPEIEKLFQSNTSPRRIRTLLAVSNLVETNRGTTSHFTVEGARQSVLDYLKQQQALTDNESPELRHAIRLAGELKASDAAPYLVPLLKPDFKWIDDLIPALADIGAPDVSEKIVALLESKIDFDERLSKSQSKRPVFEDEPEKAKTYWVALKSLAKLPSEKAAMCLIKAANDFAPDKRQEALSSLIDMLDKDSSLLEAHKTELHRAVARGLEDASVNVRSVALVGVGRFDYVDLIPQVLSVAGAKEVSLFKQCSAVLKQLADSGHRDQVSSSLKSKAAAELNYHNKRRLLELSEKI